MVDTIPLCDIKGCTEPMCTIDKESGVYLCSQHNREYFHIHTPSLLSQRTIMSRSSPWSTAALAGYLLLDTTNEGFDAEGWGVESLGTLPGWQGYLSVFEKPFHFGAYEATIRCFPSAKAGLYLYPFAFLRKYIGASFGAITICSSILNGWYLYTFDGSGSNYYELFTPTHDPFSQAVRFGIDWSPSDVILSVDDVEVAHSTQYIPQLPMSFEAWLAHTVSPGAKTGFVITDFRRLR